MCNYNAADTSPDGDAVVAKNDLSKFAGRWEGSYDAGPCTGLIVKDGTVLYIYGKWGPWSISRPGAFYAKSIDVDGDKMTITSPHGTEVEYTRARESDGSDSLTVLYGARNYRAKVVKAAALGHEVDWETEAA